MEVIPAVDIMKGKVVRLLRGDPKSVKSYDYFGDPVSTAQMWKEQGANSLHIIDLDASLSLGRNLETIHKIVHSTKMPLQVGGGIRNFESAKSLLEIGVNRVILGSLAFKEPSILAKITEEFGEERVVVALDHKDEKVMVEGWRISTELGIEEALSKFLGLRIKTFLVTSIATDGTLTGPDIRVLERVCAYDRANIISAGGIGSLNDLMVLKRIGVEGAVVGKAFYERVFTLNEALKAVRGD